MVRLRHRLIIFLRYIKPHVMELLRFVLPLDVVRRVRLYHSHPVADIVRSNPKFKDRRYRIERVHGCPYDRGGADAYYRRLPSPHYWRFGINAGTVYDLNPDEIEAYHLGYVDTPLRR